MKCARHQDTETALTCGRCDTPVCVRCLVHTDVGIRCRTCAPVRRSIPGFGDNRFRNAVIFVGVVFVAVLLIGGGSQLGGSPSGPGDYPEFLDDLRQQFQPEVTVTRLVDPWLPPSPETPPPVTRRLVALEVMIEYPDERQETHSVSSSYFKLIDSDDFVYGATPYAIDSALREGLELSPGQRTRGWVLFEIDADTRIKSVAYALDEVSLPEPETGAVADGE
jgi:hypothetical protein